MATKKKSDDKSAKGPAAKAKAKAAPATAAKKPASKAGAAKKAAPKAGAGAARAAAPKPVKAPRPASGPLARVKAAFGDKESLVKTIVEPLKRGGEDADQLKTRLLKASNHQLLRLAKTVEIVTKRYG